MSAAAPDANARETFLHRILARIAPIYARLTRLQLVAVTRLSAELDWSPPATSAINIARGRRTSEPLGRLIAIIPLQSWPLPIARRRQHLGDHAIRHG